MEFEAVLPGKAGGIVSVSCSCRECMRCPRRGNSAGADFVQQKQPNKGNTAQIAGSVGDAFSAICCLQIFRFTSSKPSKSAIASDAKFIRLRTNSFVRYCLKNRTFPHPIGRGGSVSRRDHNRVYRRAPVLTGGTNYAEAYPPIASRSSGGSAREELLSEKLPPSHPPNPYLLGGIYGR